MFRNKIIIISFIIIIVAIVMGWRLLFMDPSDQQKYQALMDKINSKTDKNKDQVYSARQIRDNVTKNFHYNQDGKTSQIRLEGKQSEIVLDHTSEATSEIVECL